MFSVITAVLVYLVLAEGRAAQNKSDDNAIHMKATYRQYQYVNHGRLPPYDMQPATRKIDNMACPTWFISKHHTNGSTTCECGSSLENRIICNSTYRTVVLHLCFCMTFAKDNRTLVVGSCFYGCRYRKKEYYYKNAIPYYSLPPDSSQLNIVACQYYNREGQLCGKCRDGYSLPVYSYNVDCIECTNYGNNWVKYVAIAFLPLTGFCLIVVVFRVNLTSGPLAVFVLLCQIGYAPPLQRALALRQTPHKYLVNILYSLYGFWSLDFFSLLYEPFCLHPKMGILQILALNYVIAVYPLLLIVITYILVELHDRNISVIVWLWRPFHECFRREWNIKTSLIDAFATFILLSHAKILSVSFDLLLPVWVFDIHGQSLSKLYVYSDATLEFFGSEHLPYAVLALGTLIIFNILPLLLLFLYPCQCFQRAINYCGLRCQALHTFMDVFQGCYKDGTNGTRDCRWFAALYLLIKIIFFMLFAITVSDLVVTFAAAFTFILLSLNIIAKPYKYNAYNVINTTLLTVYSLALITGMASAISYSQTLLYKKFYTMITFTLITIPFIFFTVFVLYKVLAHIRCIRQSCYKISTSGLVLSFCRRIKTN